MEAVARIAAALSICAFITRINYDALDVAQLQPADRFLSLEVRVGCGDFDMAILSPAERATVEKAVEDSFNRVYLSHYGDYLSYVGWTGSTRKSEALEGLVTNRFETTLVHIGDRTPPESFMKDKLHSDWEISFRGLLPPKFGVDPQVCHLDLVEPRNHRLGAPNPTPLPLSAPSSNVSDIEKGRHK